MKSITVTFEDGHDSAIAQAMSLPSDDIIVASVLEFLADKVLGNAKISVNPAKKKALCQDLADVVATFNLLNTTNFEKEVVVIDGESYSLDSFKYDSRFSLFASPRRVVLQESKYAVDLHIPVVFNETLELDAGDKTSVIRGKPLTPNELLQACEEICGSARGHASPENYDNARYHQVLAGSVAYYTDGERVAGESSASNSLIPIFWRIKFFTEEYWGKLVTANVKNDLVEWVTNLNTSAK